MQLKQTSPDGHTAYLAYSSDTDYMDNVKQKTREDSNYYATLKYRQKLTDIFDREFFNKTFGNNKGKIRGVW